MISQVPLLKHWNGRDLASRIHKVLTIWQGTTVHPACFRLLFHRIFIHAQLIFLSLVIFAKSSFL